MPGKHEGSRCVKFGKRSSLSPPRLKAHTLAALSKMHPDERKRLIERAKAHGAYVLTHKRHPAIPRCATTLE